MLEIIRATITTMPIRDVKDKNLLIFKGLYQLPKGWRGFVKQFKFNRACH